MNRQGWLARRSIGLLMPRHAAGGLVRAVPFVLLAALLGKPAEYLLFFKIGNLSNWLFPGAYHALIDICGALSVCAWAIGLTMLMIATCRLINPGCQDTIWGCRSPSTGGRHCDR